MEDRRRGRPLRKSDKTLTEPELHVLRLVSEDFSDKEIAYEMGVSVSTVKGILNRVKRRQELQVGRVGLARFYDALPDHLKRDEFGLI